METSFNTGASINLNMQINPVLPQSNTAGDIKPSVTVEQESMDKFSKIGDLIGSISSVMFTLENDEILTLKSVGQDIRNKSLENIKKRGTDDLTLKESFQAGKLTLKNVGGAALDGAKHGAIVDGALSVIINGYRVLAGKESGSEAIGSFTADVVSGTLSGAGGAMTGGLAALGLGTVGMTGIPGMVLIAGAGLLGTIGVHMLTQKTGLYDSIKNNVKDMFASKA